MQGGSGDGERESLPGLVKMRGEMKLKLPEGPFKAYLFDCDGTIVDSMPLHYLAWKQALAEWNCEFPEEIGRAHV